MKAEDVAYALKETVDSGTEPASAVESMISFLKRKGASRLLPRVLHAYERIAEHSKQQKTMVIVSDESDAASVFQKHTDVDKKDATVRVDSTLIGGYIVRKKSERYDASHKGALLKLYHSITSQTRDLQ